MGAGLVTTISNAAIIPIDSLATTLAYVSASCHFGCCYLSLKMVELLDMWWVWGSVPKRMRGDFRL